MAQMSPQQTDMKKKTRDFHVKSHLFILAIFSVNMKLESERHEKSEETATFFSVLSFFKVGHIYQKNN